MTLVCRRMLIICLELLLLLLLVHSRRAATAATAAAAPPGPGCIGADQLKSRTDRFLRSHWGRWGVAADLQQGERTCEQAARAMRGPEDARSLSPWTYSLDHDADRFPHKIASARCLCDGCIINQRVDPMYNSVPVFAHMAVLRKTRCEGDPDRFVVKREFVRVPVACTCVVPKYST